MSWPTSTRQSRGYDKEWGTIRRRILARDSHLCQCTYCKAEERVRLATQVDHVVSRAKAQALGWSKQQTEADANLQSINEQCHKRKTIEEQGGTFKPARRIGADGFPLQHSGGRGE